MSLITIDRSLITQEEENEIATEADEKIVPLTESCSKSSFHRQPTLIHSEDFVMCKTSAVTLNVNSQRRTSVIQRNDNLHEHLKKILSILRFEDFVKLIVKLENSSSRPVWFRYLTIVSNIGTQNTEESIILGIDVCQNYVTIGLIVPILQDMVITLDGDGGFKLMTRNAERLFKPISVQALWAAHQSIMMCCKVAQTNAYHSRGVSHDWLGHYAELPTSDAFKLYEWNKMEDIVDMGRATPPTVGLGEANSEEEKKVLTLKANIRLRLQKIMAVVDLEDVNVVQLREMLESEMGISLTEQRQFIADQVMTIYGQMDVPSAIFDHLFLGSTFNASNGAELRRNNVTHIINVTREVDNFFSTEDYIYKNIRVYDDEQAQLLPHWENTYKFINEAKANGTRCLVHCKMGISRSGATVVAYTMKEKGMNMQQALKYVKERRPCVNPNPNFMRQLETYQGILEASSNRHNAIFQRRSAIEFGASAVDPVLRLRPKSDFTPDHLEEYGEEVCVVPPPLVCPDEYSTHGVGQNQPKSIDLEAELFAFKTFPASESAQSALNMHESIKVQQNACGTINKCTVLATSSQRLRQWHPDVYEDHTSQFIVHNINRSKSSPNPTAKITIQSSSRETCQPLTPPKESISTTALPSTDANYKPPSSPLTLHGPPLVQSARDPLLSVTMVNKSFFSCSSFNSIEIGLRPSSVTPPSSPYPCDRDGGNSSSISEHSFILLPTSGAYRQNTPTPDSETSIEPFNPKTSTSPLHTRGWLTIDPPRQRAISENSTNPTHEPSISLSRAFSENLLKFQENSEARKQNSVVMRDNFLRDDVFADSQCRQSPEREANLRHSLSLKLRPDDSWIIKNAAIKNPNEGIQLMSAELPGANKRLYSSIDSQPFHFSNLPHPVVLLADT